MKVGVVGLGYRLEYLVRVFSVLIPDFQLVGYVDPSPAGLPGLRQHGIDPGQSYESIDALAKAAPLDLLMIGSPNHLHLGHIKTALQLNLKVFCEKPVVISEAETYELLRLLHACGDPDRVMVGLVLRYAPLYVDLKKVIAEGALGEIVSIEASEHIAPYHGAFFMRDWRRYQGYSGSFILEKCCHDLDLYQGAVGARPQRVASFGGRKSFVPENAVRHNLDVYHRKPSGWMGTDKVFDSDADIIDYQTALIEYANGATMAFHTNMNVPDQFRRFCIVGSKGMAEGDFIRNFFKVHDARTSDVLLDTTYETTELSQHYGADEQMVKDIAAHLTTGAALPVSVIDALEAGLTAIKIDEARQSRSVIDLTETWKRFDAARNGETPPAMARSA
ncbi:Gfo/Idh/MocA family protein [Methylovirgula sp. 4M-Z18]|uniref:Gfo/Idh/MocA family protein n=1 Tax=Methylovirgula sp. 4M-Z18 TaxID=2293567 RepID=UPI000E2F4999|nr:Gfo/Idh/MocA family oxidoreductase [Methylovirgula sp. 4M-Z18]RFB80325.1 gfo/Idh/MocA family oxidoreductase [Methylovirgula sp. 4M-Z18]